MPFDPELAERMREVIAGHDEVVEKRMFGGICWMLGGHMLCGVEVGRYMFRVGKEQEAEALARPGASRMAFTGRPMGGFVWVRADDAVGVQLAAWVELEARYVRTLPPK